MKKTGQMTRREFLAVGVAGTGAVVLTASGLLSLPKSALAVTARSFTLRAREGTIRTVDSKTLYAMGFADADGLFSVPGPVLWANEGDPLTVTLVNESPQGHSFVIDGVVSGATVLAGGSGSFLFTAPHAGTYVYYDPLDHPLNRALGMYGALVVTPSDGSNHVWAGGPAFANQFLQVISELDETWNTAAGNGQPVNTAVYRPNYFFINGRGSPDSESDPNAHIMGLMGQTILIRWANAGLVPHSMHTHGFHFKIVQQNGMPETAFREKDNVPVYPGDTMDVTMYFDQKGLYPIHDHILMANTGNGVYPNGIMGMLNVA